MLLTGALRAFAGACLACRQASNSLALSAPSHVEGNISGALRLMVSAYASSASPSFTAFQQQTLLQQSRCASSLAVKADGSSAVVPVLRDADDEALSPHPPTTGTTPLTVRYPFDIDYYKDSEAVVFSLDERPLGLVRLPGAAFNVPVRLDILHRVARYWRAKWQQGTHKTKTRGEVRGGGRKPWPQKGTGQARHGSIRSPLWKGGGVTFGPVPRSHAHKLTRSTMRLGMRCALSAKINEGRFFVVDDLLKMPPPANGPAAAATTTTQQPTAVRDYRELKDRLTQLTEGTYGTTWLLVDSGETGSDGGARLRKMLKPSVVMHVMSPEQLTVFHVLKYHRLVVTRAAVEALGEMLTRPHRVTKPVKHAWWVKRKEQLEATVRELNEAGDQA